MTVSRFSALIYIPSVLFALIDSVRNPNFIEKIFHISSAEILGIIFLMLLVLRIRKEKFLSSKLIQVSLFSGIAILILGCLLALIGSLQGANFIYSRTLLNLDRLFILGAFLASIGALGQPNIIYQRYYKQIIFLAGLGFLVILYFVSLLPFNFFEQIIKEGSLIENVQFLVLLLASYFSLRHAFRFIKKKQVLLGSGFAVFSFGLLLVACDEIAWGQQLFGFQTPELIARNNHQNETTIHNAYTLAGLVPFVYILIGLYGSFAWIFVKNKLYAPGNYLFPFFFIPALYNTIAFFSIPHIGVWSEPAELMLYAGVLFHLIIPTISTLKK